MNKATNTASKFLIRDIALMVVGARAMRSVGIKPTSFWGGTTLGFFAGEMANEYGFSARKTLTFVESAMGYQKIDGSFEVATGSRDNLSHKADKGTQVDK